MELRLSSINIIFYCLCNISIGYSKFVTRREWGARAPSSVERFNGEIPIVVIHHSAVPGACYTETDCGKAMRDMQDLHQLQNGWDDIGYSYAVGGDGNIYEGRGFNVVGAHARGYNSQSVGICLIGDWTALILPQMLSIVSREEWGAKPAKNIQKFDGPAPFVIIHHSYEPAACYTSEECVEGMKWMQDFHQINRGWNDIGYTYAIGGDGKIYEGRGFNTVGTHAPNYNSRSVGIVLIGDWRTFLFPVMLSVVSRQEWGAKPPKLVEKFDDPAPYVIIHHSYQPPACYTPEDCIQAMKWMQDFHQNDRGWNDIGYSFAVGGDGRIYQGRGFNVVGAHAPKYNDKSVGICVIGDWRTELPPKNMLIAVQNLIDYGIKTGHIRPDYTLLGHRQVRDTECPGDALFNEIKTWPQWSPTPNRSTENDIFT